jgi:C1A family cysteine protease
MFCCLEALMLKNKFLSWGALVLFVLLGDLSASGSAPETNREIAAVQRAIAAEKLEWQAGETPLSALGREERLKRLGGRLSPAPRGMSGERFPAPLSLPAVLDWRNNGGDWISSVKDQGSCGSCWAFATTALLEAMVKISRRMSEDIDLSEQMLLSCSQAGDCVLGGYADQAAEYIRRTGIPNESCYPYLASDTPCNPCAGWAARVVRIASWNEVASSNDAIEAALQDAPVASWMAVYSDLYHYRSGVYQPTSGASYEGGHFVVIVGYNRAGNYWICKNSWGTAWGEEGFFRIRRGTSAIGDYVIRMLRPQLENTPPVLHPVPDQSVEEGRTLAFPLEASDSDGDPLSFTAAALPEGAVLDAASGTFSWTPTYTQSGVYSVRFRASDGFAEDEQTVTITVINVKRLQW